MALKESDSLLFLSSRLSFVSNAIKLSNYAVGMHMNVDTAMSIYSPGL